jgi:hypothetical protein
MMKRNTLCLALILAAGMGLPEAHAGLPSKVLQETTEFLVKKFGREVAEEGAERLTGRLAVAVARHGDDVVSAVRKVGPKAIGLVDEAGENAPTVIRLLNRYGDDAARVLSRPKGLALVSRFGDDAAAVMVRHQGVAEPVLERLGQPAIQALGAVGPQSGRRLAMMAGDFAAGDRAPELLGVVARYGDRAMDFIWEHKVTLAGTAALAAFLSDPEPYLNGTADIAKAGMEAVSQIADSVAENAVKPAVIAAGNAAEEAASFMGQVLLVVFVVVGAVITLAIKSGILKSWPVRLGLRVAGKQAASALFKQK